MTNTIEINYKTDPKLQWLDSDSNITDKIIYKVIEDDLSTIYLDKEESIDFNDIKFTTSDQNIATVDMTGNVTIINEGIVTISAIFNGNKNYNSKTALFVINIKLYEKIDPNLYWTNDNEEIINDTLIKLYEEDNVSVIYLHKPENIDDSHITYNSSNKRVATIDENGNVTIIGSGKTIISATFEGDEYYNKQNNISYTLLVLKNEEIIVHKLNPILQWFESDTNITNKIIHKVITNNISSIHLVKDDNIDFNDITFESSNIDIASVDNTGNISIVNNGIVAISAIFNGNENYNEKIALFVIEIKPYEKIDPNLYWINTNKETINNTLIEISMADNVSNIYLYKPKNIDNNHIIYSSSNESVAVIDENGNVTNIGTGETIISATFEGDEYYNEQSTVSYTLSITSNTRIYPNIKWKIDDYIISSLKKIKNDDLSNISLEILDNITLSNISYSSSNENIATIDENGHIDIIDSGETIISALFSGDFNYKPFITSFNLIIQPITKINPNLKWIDYNELNDKIIYKSTIDDISNICLTKPEDISYDDIEIISSNENVISVNNNQLNIVGSGIAAINAIFNGDTNEYYNSENVIFVINVSQYQKTNPEIYWQQSGYSNVNNITIHRALNESVSNIILIKPENILYSEIIFSSSNENVITVNETGKLNITGLGYATINASFGGNKYYNNLDNISFDLEIREFPRINPELKWKVDNEDINTSIIQYINKTKSNIYLEIPNENLELNEIIFSSSNEDVAIIDDNGQLSIIGLGQTTINALFNGNEYYTDQTISFVLFVNKAIKKNPNLKWFDSDEITNKIINKVITNNISNIHLTKDNGIDFDNIIFESSNTNVAIVNNTGNVSIVSDGIVAISATYLEDDEYDLQTALFVLNIKYYEKINPNLYWVQKKNIIKGTLKVSIEDSLSNVHIHLNDNIDYNEISYNSSDDNIATIDNFGNITLINTGEVTISASFNGNEYYNAQDNISFVLNINDNSLYENKENPELKWKYDNKIIRYNHTRYISDDLSNIYVSKPNDIDWSNVIYSSSNENIATIDENGHIDIIDIGETIISIEFNGDEKYYLQTVSFNLIIERDPKVNPNLNWMNNDTYITNKIVNKLLQDNLSNIYLQLPEDLQLENILFESSNTNVATIDNNGHIEIISNGISAISATYDGNDIYNSQTIIFVLNVEKIIITKKSILLEWKQRKYGTIDNLTINRYTNGSLYNIYVNNPENVELTYQSSDENVAIINEYGQINIIGVGETIISAIFIGNEIYNPKTVSFNLNINEIVKLNPNFKWKQGQLNFINNSTVNITCKKNDIITSIYLEKPNDVLDEDIIFTSSDSGVAEILNNGEIIVYTFGETTISASFNGNDKYFNVDEISFTLITNELEKKTPNFVWKCGDENIDSVLHKTLLDRSDDIYLVKPYQILLTNITYSSSNEDVAVIDETGRIYIEGVGYTIITASFSGDDLYTSKDNIWFKLEIDDVSFDDNIEEEENNSIISTYKKTSKIKTINLGPYQYLYEYLKNDEDFHDLGCSDNFVILRNFEIINDVIYDKDIFFIEKTIYNKLIQNNSQDIVCYPLYKNGSLFFSNTYEFFTTYNVNIKDITYNVYEEINDNEEIEADILCDKLRIYNPVVNKNLDFITYVDNYINNIHFHYFCNLNKNFKKQYTGELKVNNNRYIEYIELNIPNIKKLFNAKNKYFIKEDFNKIAFENDYSLDLHFYNMYKMQSNIEMFNQLYGNKLYLSKMIKPFMIDKLDIKVKDENQQEQIITKNVKTYIDDKYFNYNSNYINTSLNITLYPYSDISNNLYILHDIIGPSSIFIPYENYFRLSSHLGFDNGVISLINEFIFPNKQKSNNVNRYEYTYDNSFIEYSDNINEYTNQNQQENNQENNINNEIDRQVTQQYNAYFLHENISNYDTRDEFDEDLDIEEIRSTGFVIQIALDINFEEIILESIINTDNPNNNFIYDFSFSLNDMVDSWDQLNDILIMRAKFIDKRLNIVITGNNVIITKEWFKYLVNDNKNYIIKFNTNNLIENMDTNYFNFIDHINCVITDETDKSISAINNSIANTKLIYKPIFYKVQDLQNIRIRQGVTQNIGVNLGEFINKVSTFILNIDDQTIKESSRNDVFVIFSINANNIENNTGYYNILDDNFEYISSGNYIKY